MSAGYDALHYGPDASQFEHARHLRKQRDQKAQHNQHHNYPPNYGNHQEQLNNLDQVGDHNLINIIIFH